MKDITVFISYSWESKEIDKFVKWFACFLRKYNFNVKLDKFEVYPGSNLQKYMLEGLNESKYILSVVTESYKMKMEDPTTGVGTEINHIQQMVSSPFIIPIVHNGKTIELPELFNGKFASRIDMYNPISNKNKDEIFRLLSLLATKEELLPESSSSPIEKYAVTIQKQKLLQSIFDNMLFDVETESSVKFYYANNNNKFTIGHGEASFITEWTKCGSDTIYSCNQVNTMCRIKSLDNLERIKSISCIESLEPQNISWSSKFNIGDGILWINQHDIAAVGLIKNIYTVDEDFECYIEFDYKILVPIENESPFVEQS